MLVRKVCRSPSLMRCAVTAWSASPIQAWTVLRHSQLPSESSTGPASPSLIARSSEDPFLTAFQLSWELQELSKLKTSYKADTRSSSHQCSALRRTSWTKPGPHATGVESSISVMMPPSARGGQQWAGSTEIGHQIRAKKRYRSVLQSCIVEVKSLQPPLESEMWIIFTKIRVSYKMHVVYLVLTWIEYFS